MVHYGEYMFCPITNSGRGAGPGEAISYDDFQTTATGMYNSPHTAPGGDV